MPFDIGFGTIGPGGVQRWWYRFGGGADQRAQYAINPSGL
jgi:hypothetical protein